MLKDLPHCIYTSHTTENFFCNLFHLAFQYKYQTFPLNISTQVTDMWDDQIAGHQLFALEMSHEHTEAFRRGSLSKAERMKNYQDTLKEVDDLFTNQLQLEWAPKGGTMMAFIRYGANSAYEEDHGDLENDDIDLFIGIRCGILG